MRRRLLFCLLATGVLAAAGCGTPRAQLASQPLLGSVVGREELVSSGRLSLLDALHIVRPMYFQSRGQTTLSDQYVAPMIVVIDGLVVSDLDVLNSTHAADVLQVRRLGPVETFQRYNRSVSVGALEITLWRK